MEETEIVGRLSAVEQRSRSNSHRLEALEKQTEAVNRLATSVAVMAEKVETTGDKVDSLCVDVQEIKQKPAKRWETVTAQVVSILVAAVLGYIIARLGLG